MTDLFKSKENEFYIELSQERYYIPGEDIAGDVVLDLKKATKTNNIKVILEGNVEIGGRNISLFSKSTLIAESPEGDQRSHYLEPHTHRFPFRLRIPSSKECKMPSTLEITKLLKVSYRLVAIYNKAFSVLEKFCPTTSMSINILEDINVDKAEYTGEQRIEKELLLSGEKTRKVKVSTIVAKRAAVKSDIIPISVTIQHIGVMVRDKALSVQLLRSVYYGKNKSELFGPKVIRQVDSNIEIPGPTSFTRTFDVQLPIPSNICPTVDESSLTFKIEYSLRVSINLNEENPLRPETAGDIVIFNVPFVIGTYPKLAFNIDDDEEEEEEELDSSIDNASQLDDFSNPFEYDQVAEKMKELDLDSEIYSPIPPQQPSAIQHSVSISHTESTLESPKPSLATIKSPIPQPTAADEQQQVEVVSPPLDRISSINSTQLPTPKLEYASNSGEESSPPKTFYLANNQPSFHHKQNLATNTPPPELSTFVQQPPTSPLYKAPNIKMNPSDIYNDFQPQSPLVSRHDSVASLHPSTSTSTTHSHNGLGRQESVRWIVRNQDAPAPAVVSPQIPPRPSPTPSHAGGFVMPTPSYSGATNQTATSHCNDHYQQEQTHYVYSSSPPQPQFYNSYNNSMSIPQQQRQPHHPQPLPYTNHNHSYTDLHYQQSPFYPPYTDAVVFPQPQLHPQASSPQPFSGGFVGMPSHQSPYYSN
ncbi:hypothetical protein [Parasitella parasitica]|uniref:Arrestin C-terminal-like domain-containing protein n=1 Tax=Parasitella parasitica TaxID=35722 RepID=A0A0B7N1U2_9FUNG|nr:hypothetical protein [Parasitella parasitica]